MNGVVMKCGNEDDGMRHQQQAVPQSVADDYARLGRKFLCTLCRHRRIAEQPAFSMQPEDPTTTLFDKWGRVRDQQVPDA